MKIALLIIPLAAAAATTACVPMYGAQAMHGAPVAYPPYQPAVYGPSIPVGAMTPSVGRWDNVMMLPYGASLDVLTADGRRMSAEFVAATSTLVRVQSASGEIEIPAQGVIRIDRWLGGAEGARSVARDAARGAAVGAGAIGVLGLLVGHMPPAHTFVGGAIAGGYDNAQAGRALRHSITVYLAPSVTQRQ
jgi:hypothetical protein